MHRHSSTSTAKNIKRHHSLIHDGRHRYTPDNASPLSPSASQPLYTSKSSLSHLTSRLNLTSRQRQHPRWVQLHSKTNADGGTCLKNQFGKRISRLSTQTSFQSQIKQMSNTTAGNRHQVESTPSDTMQLLSAFCISSQEPSMKDSSRATQNTPSLEGSGDKPLTKHEIVTQALSYLHLDRDITDLYSLNHHNPATKFSTHSVIAAREANRYNQQRDELLSTLFPQLLAAIRTSQAASQQTPASTPSPSSPSMKGGSPATNIGPPVPPPPQPASSHHIQRQVLSLITSFLALRYDLPLTRQTRKQLRPASCFSFRKVNNNISSFSFSFDDMMLKRRRRGHKTKTKGESNKSSSGSSSHAGKTQHPTKNVKSRDGLADLPNTSPAGPLSAVESLLIQLTEAQIQNAQTGQDQQDGNRNGGGGGGYPLLFSPFFFLLFAFQLFFGLTVIKDISQQVNLLDWGELQDYLDQHDDDAGSSSSSMDDDDASTGSSSALLSKIGMTRSSTASKDGNDEYEWSESDFSSITVGDDANFMNASNPPPSDEGIANETSSIAPPSQTTTVGTPSASPLLSATSQSGTGQGGAEPFSLNTSHEGQSLSFISSPYDPSFDQLSRGDSAGGFPGQLGDVGGGSNGFSVASTAGGGGFASVGGGMVGGGGGGGGSGGGSSVPASTAGMGHPQAGGAPATAATGSGTPLHEGGQDYGDIASPSSASSSFGGGGGGGMTSSALGSDSDDTDAPSPFGSHHPQPRQHDRDSLLASHGGGSRPDGHRPHDDHHHPPHPMSDEHLGSSTSPSLPQSIETELAPAHQDQDQHTASTAVPPPPAFFQKHQERLAAMGSRLRTAAAVPAQVIKYGMKTMSFLCRIATLALYLMPPAVSLFAIVTLDVTYDKLLDLTDALSNVGIAYAAPAPASTPALSVQHTHLLTSSEFGADETVSTTTITDITSHGDSPQEETQIEHTTVTTTPHISYPEDDSEQSSTIVTSTMTTTATPTHHHHDHGHTSPLEKPPREKPYVFKYLYECWWTWLAFSLQHSGATFIKLGQYLSSRPDLLSPDICEILSQLQSSTHTHPWEDTCRILEQELGSDWQQYIHISDDDQTPVGSGCIAQVYRGRVNVKQYQHLQETISSLNSSTESDSPAQPSKAGHDIRINQLGSKTILEKLASDIETVHITAADSTSRATPSVNSHGHGHGGDGDENNEHSDPDSYLTVAIKVLHPHATWTIRRDIELLFIVTRLTEALPFAELHFASPYQLMVEFARLMFSQLDLRQEARNLLRFQSNFRSFRNNQGGANSDVFVTPDFPTPLISRQTALVETFHGGIPMSDFIEIERIENRLAKYGLAPRKDVRDAASTSSLASEHDTSSQQPSLDVRGIESTPAVAVEWGGGDTATADELVNNCQPIRVSIDNDWVYHSNLDPTAKHNDWIHAIRDPIRATSSHHYLSYHEEKLQKRKEELQELYNILDVLYHAQAHDTPVSLESQGLFAKLTTLKQIQQEQILANYSPQQYVFLKKEVGRTGLATFLNMLFAHGFFHADLHPGNMIVDVGYDLLTQSTLDGLLHLMTEQYQERIRQERQSKVMSPGLVSAITEAVTEAVPIAGKMTNPYTFFTDFEASSQQRAKQYQPRSKLMASSNDSTMAQPSAYTSDGDDNDLTSITMESLLEDIRNDFYNSIPYDPSHTYPSSIFNVLNADQMAIHPLYANDKQKREQFKGTFQRQQVPISSRQPRLIMIDAGMATALSNYDKANFNDLFFCIATGNGYEGAKLMIERARSVGTTQQQQAHRVYEKEMKSENFKQLLSQLYQEEQAKERMVRQLAEDGDILMKIQFKSQDLYQRYRQKVKNVVNMPQLMKMFAFPYTDASIPPHQVAFPERLLANDDEHIKQFLLENRYIEPSQLLSSSQDQADNHVLLFETDKLLRELAVQLFSKQPPTPTARGGLDSHNHSLDEIYKSLQRIQHDYQLDFSSSPIESLKIPLEPEDQEECPIQNVISNITSTNDAISATTTTTKQSVFTRYGPPSLDLLPGGDIPLAAPSSAIASQAAITEHEDHVQVQFSTLPFNPLQTQEDRIAFIRTVGDLIRDVSRRNYQLDSVGVVSTLTSLISAARQYHVKLDTSFISVVIAVTVMEGVGRSLDGNIDVITPAMKIIASAKFKDLQHQLMKIALHEKEQTLDKQREIDAHTQVNVHPQTLPGDVHSHIDAESNLLHSILHLHLPQMTETVSSMTHHAKFQVLDTFTKINNLDFSLYLRPVVAAFDFTVGMIQSPSATIDHVVGTWSLPKESGVIPIINNQPQTVNFSSHMHLESSVDSAPITQKH